MVRFWPLHLFGEMRKRARDPTFSPIFEQPVVVSTPMVSAPGIRAHVRAYVDKETQWRSSIRLANVPAYADYDDEEDREPMWYREAHHPSGCPCCIEGTGFPRPPSATLGSDYSGIRKVSRASTHISTNSADSEASSAPVQKETGSDPACDPTVRVRRSVSTFGLRMKKSMKNLRGRPSGNLQ
ncbi:hypothetical protein J7T55_013705 [Diaporthe amygdali]|uniref:uncharacterized protein n=1 Tax=Phomopsis amygdali TaxID=1214568 RepID=UPI0022FE7D5E|nr:uncharacterized protein J7T55_013705 [Diaporthe amygdali]KAJ0119503.1 hypothetical protein J7T55_013705 [Diaporthe amygdali]